MNSQDYFNYEFSENKDLDNFFINKTNQDVFNALINNSLDDNVFLFGPRKSGKTHLLNIWKKKNSAAR